MKFIIAVVLLASTLLAVEKEKSFSIDAISVKIYDNLNNQILDKPTNVYGNNMNLFLAVKISQTTQNMKKYTLKINGQGKGRENEAEGLVKDYEVDASKKIVLYSSLPKFVPFVFAYPCTDEETFTITLTSEKGEKVSKEIVNKLTSCYLN